MAPRAYWKGYLKLSLVSCPIALYPASSASERVSFHRINRKTGNRLKQQMIDPETGEVLPDGAVDELRKFKAIFLGAVGHHLADERRQRTAIDDQCHAISPLNCRVFLPAADSLSDFPAANQAGASTFNLGSRSGGMVS